MKYVETIYDNYIINMLRNFKQGKLIVKINVSTQNKLIQNLAYNLKKKNHQQFD